jgi:predicted amidohydrolase
MENLRITIVQTDLVWENIKENLENHYQLIKNLRGKTDLIVLPEMFTTGFSLNVKSVAQNMKSETVIWLKSMANELNVALTGSFICEENNQFFNRQLFVFPNGDFQFYDKRHLFRMGDENNIFTSGNKQVIVNFKNWRINLFTCYDLRFPVWSRNKNNYDLAIYVANWPESRKKVWQTLLAARAIENQIYVVGVNRVGIDGMNIKYSGNSLIIDAKGNQIVETNENKIEVKTFELTYSELENFRKSFPVFLDADEFEIKI